MKNNIIVRTVLLGVIAAAVTLLSFQPRFVSVDSLVGYSCILMLLGLAGLEYRFNWKWLFGR
jgi:hypothetical protein